MDNDDQQLHQDSPSKGRKPSVKRSKSAGVNFAGKKSALTVKPQSGSNDNTHTMLHSELVSNTFFFKYKCVVLSIITPQET